MFTQNWIYYACAWAGTIIFLTNEVAPILVDDDSTKVNVGKNGQIVNQKPTRVFVKPSKVEGRNDAVFDADMTITKVGKNGQIFNPKPTRVFLKPSKSGGLNNADITKAQVGKNGQIVNEKSTQVVLKPSKSGGPNNEKSGDTASRKK